MKNFKLNIGWWVLSAFVLVALFSSCKKDFVQQDPGVAKIRVVNTLLSENPHDFYQDNTRLTTNAVGYGAYSNYMGAVGGYSVLWFKDALLNTASAVSDVVLANDAKYTLFLYSNGAEKFFIAGYINNDKVPAAGKFRVRFLNLCAAFDNKKLNIVDQAGLPINSQLGFGADPVYFEINTDNVLKVKVEDSAVITHIPGSEFQEGKNYLVWFDTVDGGTVQYHIVPQD